MKLLCYECYKKIRNMQLTNNTAEMSDEKFVCENCGKKTHIVVNVRKSSLNWFKNES